MPRRILPGTPSRSPGYVFPARAGRMVTWSLAAAAVALVGWGTVFFLGFEAVASPGLVATAHAPVGAECALCHEPVVAAVDLRCERCHDPLDARRLAAPAHVAMSGHAALPGGAADEGRNAELRCAACHVEHRGRDTTLAEVADGRCASCHFSSFRSHPEVAAVRAQQYPAADLDFSHEIHVREIAKTSGDRCQSCHEPTADQAGFAPISFDDHCASCHVKDGVLTLNGIDVLTSGWTPAALLPPGDDRTPAPAIGPPDERGRVIVQAVAHRDPWMLMAAHQITRAMATPVLAYERAKVTARIERLSSLAQAVPVTALADGDLDQWARTLRAEIGALDRQIATGGAAGDEAAAALNAIASAVDPSLGRLPEAPAGAPRAGAAAAAPADPQQFETRRQEIDALLQAVAARTSGPVADRAADLRRRLGALGPDSSAAQADEEALAEWLRAIDATLRTLETAGATGAAAELYALRRQVEQQMSDGLAPEDRDARRRELLSLLDALATSSSEPVRARVAELRAALNALPDGSVGVTRARRDQKGRLLQRIELEQTLRAAYGRALVEAAVAAERTAAGRLLDRLRGEAATLDAQIAAAPQLTGSGPLRGLLDSCLRCHRLTDDETAMRPVLARRSMLAPTTFIHRPHLLQTRCETCHSTVATSKAGVDVNLPAMATCQSCHNSSQVSAACVSCHLYHPRSAAELAVASW